MTELAFVKFTPNQYANFVLEFSFIIVFLGFSSTFCDPMDYNSKPNVEYFMELEQRFHYLSIKV